MLLEWVAPPECPPEAAVVSRVKTLAGERAASRALQVRARVVRVDTRRWRLELVIGDESPEPRVVESDDCAKLANATALIVSLDLQAREKHDREEHPERHVDGAVPPPAAEDDRRPPPPRRAALPPTSRPSLDLAPPDAPHLLLGTRLLGDAGSLPAPAPGVRIFGALAYHAWRVELGGTLWGRARATVDGQPDLGALTYLRTIDARGCWRSVTAPIELDTCAGLEAGAARAVGYGVRSTSASVAPWLAGLLDVTVQQRVSPRLSASATIGLGVPILIPEAVIDGIGPVYSPAPVFGRVAIGFETVLF